VAGAGEQRRQDRHHREVACDPVALIAAPPDGGDRVVVVPTRPHRPALGEDGEIGRRLPGPRAVAPDRGDGDVDEVGVVGAEVAVVDAERGQTSGRLA
jgi:hypothetical protein